VNGYLDFSRVLDGGKAGEKTMRAEAVVLEAAVSDLRAGRSLPDGLQSAVDRVVTPAWYYTRMADVRRTLEREAKFHASEDDVLRLAARLASKEGHANRREDIRLAVLHDDPTIRRRAQHRFLAPILAAPDALDDATAAELARFMTAAWAVDEWADVAAEAVRDAPGSPAASPQALEGLLQLARRLPSTQGRESMRTDLERMLVERAAEVEGPAIPGIWAAIQSFLVPEWFAAHGSGMDRARLLLVLDMSRVVREKGRDDGETFGPDAYEQAYRRYLKNSGSASNPTSGRAFHAMLDWLRKHPGQDMPVAFRQTTRKYRPLEEDDLPWAVSLKISNESRRLIQPDESVYGEIKSLERERTMLANLIEGMNDTFGRNAMGWRPVMRLELGEEKAIQESGVGVLIDYALEPRGYRWGDRLDAELGKLVFVDFEINWTVTFLSGRGMPERRLRFTSEPPQSVTVDFAALKGNYAKAFDYVILEAIEDFQAKFNERMGIRRRSSGRSSTAPGRGPGKAMRRPRPRS